MKNQWNIWAILTKSTDRIGLALGFTFIAVQAIVFAVILIIR